jgi:hypothetical protein
MDIKNILQLQREINGLLRISSKPDDSLIFNIKDHQFYNETYRQLLQFSLDSLKDFLQSPEGFKSYMVPDITGIEKSKFFDKKGVYYPYTDNKIIRERLRNLKQKRNRTHKPIKVMDSRYLSAQELFTYNREYRIREYMKDKDFNEKPPEHILKIFKERVEEMGKCLTKHEHLVNKTKSNDDLLFLRTESDREKIMLSSIANKASADLMTELKKMANYVMWGVKQIKCYYNGDGTLKNPEQLNKDVDDILDKLRAAKAGDPNCVKKMMTFLPLSIFKVVKSNGELSDNLSSFEDRDQFDYYEDRLRKYYIDNAIPRDYETGNESNDEKSIINGPQTQFRLGIGYDLFRDRIGQLYSDMNGLWSTYSTDLDLFNSCGKYINYSIYINLLQMYMFMIKSNSVFPSSFSLRKEIRPDGIDRNIYNVKTQTYEFRYKDPIGKKNLFNPNMKFIGVHFIKYVNNERGGKLSVLPLFVFINKNFSNIKAIPRTDTKVTTIGFDFISSYTGDEREIITCNNKMYFVEDGEISPSMSLTYHELTNILYYGTKTYMFDNNRKELYFTMANKDDPRLQELIELLNMTQVFFVKDKVEGFSKERFKIMTKEEIIASGNKGELMGNQQLDELMGNQQLGGWKKKTKKKITKHKITKKKVDKKKNNKTKKFN